MKKIIATICALALTLGLSTTAFAAEVNESSPEKNTDVTLTVSIAPTYTVTIPADTKIEFNKESTDFGKIELTAAQIDPGYVVKVSAEAGELKNAADESKTIPYALNATAAEGTEKSAFTSAEYLTAGDHTPLTIDITKDDWNKAFAGSYTGVVTFKVEYIQK